MYVSNGDIVHISLRNSLGNIIAKVTTCSHCPHQPRCGYYTSGYGIGSTGPTLECIGIDTKIRKPTEKELAVYIMEQLTGVGDEKDNTES